MTEQHDPLDPLDADEFRAVTRLLSTRHGVADGWRYAGVELREPDKAALAAFADGSPRPNRVADVLCFDTTNNTTYRARVDLTDETVPLFEAVPDVQTNVTVDEWEEADAALRSDPRVVQALADRGITDMDLVFMDTWTYGGELIPEQYRDRRVGWSDTWVRASEGANPYAGPVNGFHCIIDLNTMELLEIEDTFVVDRPQVMGEYVPSKIPERILNANPREPLKPLEITQPDGPSFTLEGNLLRWQNWSMRVGFNYREGMTLHEVSYRDAGGPPDAEGNPQPARRRPIAHKMSFAEMMVPYRDHSEDHYRRTAFDIGEWGLGFMTTSLELGCDCLGEIRYLDATLHDSKGEPYTIKNAICIHEEDNAVLWKHVDHDSAEVRRMRRLTVSFHVTVANYEYLVYWRFHQDGSIECEVRATGIMVVSHIDEGAPHPHGSLVDQRTYAPFHQHFLVARLDLDVDGVDNTVYMAETEIVPTGPDNPYGLSLAARNVPLRTESEGKQDYDWNTQRGWKVVNENTVNAVGTHPSYKLVPGGAIPAMFDLASPVLARCRAIEHTLWVTPNQPDERWPAGEFVNQSVTDHGLPEWTAADRSIENTDVVLWYVFGIHHITRTEDWPVMPADTVSFWLKPFGFFDRNPALDVAPSPGSHCAPQDPEVGTNAKAGGCGCGTQE